MPKATQAGKSGAIAVCSSRTSATGGINRESASPVPAKDLRTDAGHLDGILPGGNTWAPRHPPVPRQQPNHSGQHDDEGTPGLGSGIDQGVGQAPMMLWIAVGLDRSGVVAQAASS